MRVLTQWGATLVPVIQLRERERERAQRVDTVGCHPSNTTKRESSLEMFITDALRTGVGG
eukprot:scaffold84799_cov43-Phaeocystis_antarctica.AAC.1